MKQVRWYDKNPNLKNVFEFIEGLDDSNQRKIAQDILQILVNDFNLNLDNEINSISKNYTYKCKRWYDNNIDLFTSFEIIKNLPEDMQTQLVEKIVTSLLLIYLENGERYE